MFRFPPEIWKFWIFIDFFNEKMFGQKSKFFVPPKISTNNFRIFFRRKMFNQKKTDQLFRSQMIPRFQKSHLEQCAIILWIQKPCRKINTWKKTFFPQDQHISWVLVQSPYLKQWPTKSCVVIIASLKYHLTVHRIRSWAIFRNHSSVTWYWNW